MSRRGRGGVTISLFSFQDIITSVSGIIIVVVLLLALELVQRQDAGATAERVDLHGIQAALADAEAALEEKRLAAAKSETMLDDLADASPIDLQNQLRELRRRIELMQHETEELRGRGHRLETERKAVQVEWFDQKARSRELEEQRRQQAELKRRIEQEREEGRLVYSMPRGTKLKGWLALVESGTISVAPIGRASRPIQFHDQSIFAAGPHRAADQFMAWARRQSKNSAYFFLVVRPNGIEEFDTLENALTLQEFRFGFDLADQEQQVLDPQQGAGE